MEPPADNLEHCVVVPDCTPYVTVQSIYQSNIDRYHSTEPVNRYPDFTISIEEYKIDIINFFRYVVTLSGQRKYGIFPHVREKKEGRRPVSKPSPNSR
jgi:hypothetical protein